MWVSQGETLFDAAHAAGVSLASDCGGRGKCGRCAVRVLGDGADVAAREVRLACQMRPETPLRVRPMSALGPPEGAASGSRAPGGPLVAAVDLGTTIVTGVVASPVTGREIGRAWRTNPQRSSGADVLSRVSAASEGRGDVLREQAVRAAGDVVADILALGAGDAGDVSRVVVAANPVMAHLFAGADPRGLGVHPVTHAWNGPLARDAGAFGLSGLDAGTPVTVLPALGGLVGGDATAGALATDLDGEGARVLVDLGTNAEVVVGVGGRLTAASAAAGPAFEGGGLSCGMPAMPGAVVGVMLQRGDLVLDVAGGGVPEGVSGSGALQLVRVLLRTGHLDASGRLVPEGPLSHRFHTIDGVVGLWVAGEPGGEGDVHLTQLDVREIQLAKAAVATALSRTLDAAGVVWDAVDSISVAGGFGSALDGGLLEAVGLVPRGAASVTAAVGNAALHGAMIAALDPEAERRAATLAAEATVITLPEDPSFAAEFLGNTAFPSAS